MLYAGDREAAGGREPVQVGRHPVVGRQAADS
jgi:hypothetical protein